MQQVTAVPISPVERPIGTGGFLDPERIVDQFGVKEGMKIADFGSGSGYFTIILGEKVGSTGRVYALDIQEDKLDMVRAKARSHGLDNIETIRTNLEIPNSSSLSANSQDIVLLANILFQSTRQADIIKEAVKILNKGGNLIIIDWEKGTGGFGPPDGIRPDHATLKKIAEKEGLSFVHKLNAGHFHFGLIFKK